MKLVPSARRLRNLPRPRPATAIALFALVMAMGGTSVASSLISGSTLKNGSVTGKKLAKGTIDGTRLGKGAVTGIALGAGAVSWKSLGAQIVAAAPVALPVGNSTKLLPVSATATCPAGTVGIAGGQVMSDPSQAVVSQSVQAGMNGAQAGLPGATPTGWSATGVAIGYNAATMTVYAICIAAG
jgi:hypothetical protein